MISEKQRIHLVNLGLSRRGSLQCIERGIQLGFTNKGRKHSIETKEKLSKILTAKYTNGERKPANLGKTKETSESVKRISEKNKGHKPWNKDKKDCYSLETLERMRKNSYQRKQANFKTEDAIKLYQQNKSCKEVSKILGCSSSAIQRRLKPLGILRDSGWKNRGKILSEETRKRMSIAVIKRVKAHKGYFFEKGEKNPMFAKSPSHGKGCWFEIPEQGIVFLRSSWELIYAKYLIAKRVRFKYEYKRFILDGKTFLPDFYLVDEDKFIEVKGWVKDKDIQKIEETKRLYPNVKIELFTEKQFNKIEKEILPSLL